MFTAGKRFDCFCKTPCIDSVSYPVSPTPEEWGCAGKAEPPPQLHPLRYPHPAEGAGGPDKSALSASAARSQCPPGRVVQKRAAAPGMSQRGGPRELHYPACLASARGWRARVSVVGQSAGRGAGGAGGGGSGGARGSVSGSGEKAPTPPWPRRSQTPGGWSASHRTSTTPTGRPATSWR